MLLVIASRISARERGTMVAMVKRSPVGRRIENTNGIRFQHVAVRSEKDDEWQKKNNR